MLTNRQFDEIHVIAENILRILAQSLFLWDLSKLADHTEEDEVILTSSREILQRKDKEITCGEAIPRGDVLLT
ncbi:hypothetical protein KL86CLO1_11452 [uncultured Eubacteriales bacterium]|uniref:Uncharacterized protein n=1 Tax=uncultured Eubacteriales bacterium TaxID=172733 RepID=A0A212JPG7_9FIRM|nr:hypothetical protein KL86CLO1_11452 [uncultured Eubacteriales bacterium]